MEDGTSAPAVPSSPVAPSGPPEDSAALVAARSVAGASRPLVEEIIDNCDSASASASEAGSVARDIDSGVRRLEEAIAGTVVAMNEIRAGADGSTDHAVDALAQVRDRVLVGVGDIERLARSVAGMTAFVQTIRSIADQTKLLSLNARIEAARAGERAVASPSSPRRSAASPRPRRHKPMLCRRRSPGSRPRLRRPLERWAR
jgi:hypothetical protein